MTGAPERYRYRLRFGKRGALRWSGHLDLQKNIERMLRRAKLPMWYSKGYHPRPRLIFASALPLGQSSEVELLDLWLSEALEADELLSRLRRVAHPDLPLFEASARAANEPTITVQVQSARYRVELLKDEWSGEAAVDTTTLCSRVDTLLAREELLRERRGKRYDLRPLIEELETSENTLSMRLTAREGQNGRAEEVLLALDLEPADCRIERVALLMAPSPGEPDEPAMEEEAQREKEA